MIAINTLETYIVLCITLFIHSYLCTLLAKRIVKKERFTKMVRFAFCFANALFSAGVVSLFSGSNTWAYTIIILATIFELCFLFKDKLFALVAIAFGLSIHFFTFRSIVLAVYSLVTEHTMYSILHNNEQLVLSTFISFWVHIVVLILFIALIPPSAVKDIIKNKTLLNFISILMIVIGVFQIYNASIFSIDSAYFELAIQQIVLPLLLMGAFYLMLLFMIRLVMMEKYKELVQELENKIDTSQMLTDALFNLAQIVIEFNSTKKTITRIIINSVEIPLDKHPVFNEFMSGGMNYVVHPSDTEIVNKINPEKIEGKFRGGVKELNYDYRSHRISIDSNTSEVKIDSNEYLWYKMKINSRLDEATNEVLSICTIDEINDEKKAELALVEKSERDTLTGAYNKAAIRTLISDYLNENEFGALLIFDIDNFKSINDNMGHNYGDSVLCEIYDKVRPFFRASDYFGRFGGDEFVVFFKGKIYKSEIEIIAKRICDTVRNDYVVDDISVRVSASIGISVSPLHGSSYENLFEAADSALYQAKRKGKDTFVIFDRN